MINESVTRCAQSGINSFGSDCVAGMGAALAAWSIPLSESLMLNRNCRDAVQLFSPTGLIDGLTLS